LEFLRRFLQHILPPSFHRVRRFGWLHPAGRAKLKRVRALLRLPPLLSATEQKTWQPPTPTSQTNLAPTALPDAPAPASPLCPQCGARLILIGHWQPGQNSCGPLSISNLQVKRTVRPP
jgi:hypothetical protein